MKKELDRTSTIHDRETSYQDSHSIVSEGLADEARSDTTKMDLARRDFLKGVGLLVVGFSASGPISQLVADSSAEAAGVTSTAGEAGGAAALLADPPIDVVDSYLVISADGTVTGMSSLVDLGQGISQQYIQWIAEELDVSMAKIKLVLGDTGLVTSEDGMFGSRATNFSGAKFRRAAAAARAKLMELAAALLGVSADKLTVNDGVISITTDPSRSVTYAQLIAGKRFDVKIDVNIKTKPVSAYKIIGQPIPRADILAKLTAAEEYVHDVKLPGMLYGRAIRPRGQSLREHSVLVSVDESSVAGLKGLVKVVAFGDISSRPILATHTGPSLSGKNNFVGVICEREEQAIKATGLLKVKWADPPEIPQDLYEYLYTVGRGNPTPKLNGDVDVALASASRVLKATYRYPFQAHASMGAVCAVADAKLDSNGKVIHIDVWSSTQTTHRLRTNIANAFGIPPAETPDKIRVFWRWGPGSYGPENGNNTVGVDAALMSAAVGRPVKVQWFREDTFGWESYGPIHLFNIRGGLDASGRVIAYDFDSWGSTANASSDGEIYSFGRAPATFRVIGGNPTGGTFFMTAPLRAPTQPATTFASESFIDEMAAAAKIDPVRFRMQHLDPTRPGDARGLDAIKAAVEKFGWDTRVSPNPASASNRTGKVRGRGISYGNRSDVFLATIMEVEVDQTTGVVRPIRVVVAHDIGLIVNPESIKQQIEGNVTQASSRALFEEIKHNGRRVSTLDWSTYPFLNTTQVPKIESVLINRLDQPTGSGGGESASVGVAAAMGNAIFDATGARLRQVPFTPARVLEALKNR